MDVEALCGRLFMPLPFTSRQELFTVTGTPVPWKRARRNGNRYFTEPRQGVWQASIAMQVREQWGGMPVPDACALDVLVLLPRPVRHIRANGEVKDSAPLFCTSQRAGDDDNHAKAVRDALEDVLYVNDRQVVGGAQWKVYAPEPGLVLRFSVLDLDSFGSVG